MTDAVDRRFCFGRMVLLSLTVFAYGQDEALSADGRMHRLDGVSVATGGAKIRISPEIEKRFPYPSAALKNAVGEGENDLTVSIESMEDVEFLNRHKDVGQVLERHESFWIKVDPSGIRVVGSSARGALYGMTTLEAMIRESGGKLGSGEILDWPDHRRRVVHIVLRKTSSQSVHRFIDQARLARMNTIILQLADAVNLDSGVVSPRKDAYEIAEFLELVDYARANGLEVVPDVPLLTHQEKFFKKSFPELMYNNVTYDPRIDAVYDHVFRFLEEIIEIMQPRAILIGHDEVKGYRRAGRKKWLLEGENPLPPDLFLLDVERLFAYLSRKDIDVWMWGDMLIAPDEFPEMRSRHLHGVAGYHRLREQFPREIVVCDWHYFDNQAVFPSSKAFASAGYRVLGSSWKQLDTMRNFSRYVANLPVGGEGMIATTWNLVQLEEWQEVDEIISTAGEAFWNAH